MVLKCRARSTVAQKSTLTKELFKKLERIADPQTGIVTVPGELLKWRPVGDGEVLAIIDQDLQLKFKDWVPVIEEEEDASTAMILAQLQQLSETVAAHGMTIEAQKAENKQFKKIQEEQVAQIDQL